MVTSHTEAGCRYPSVYPCSGNSLAEYHTMLAHLLSAPRWPTPSFTSGAKRCALNISLQLYLQSDAAKTAQPKVTSMIRRLECLKADVLSRCGLISVSQFHSKLLHLADKSYRLCAKVWGWWISRVWVHVPDSSVDQPVETFKLWLVKQTRARLFLSTTLLYICSGTSKSKKLEWAAILSVGESGEVGLVISKCFWESNKQTEMVVECDFSLGLGQL